MSAVAEDIQRTDQWFQSRAGKVTASRIGDLMAKTKTGWGASRNNYLAQLVIERLTGQVQESYTNSAMLWGIETEPYAIEAYEMVTGALVERVGFVPHPNIEDAGASPDGLVGVDGLVECKCPVSATHIQTLLGGPIERKYILQMQFQMACTHRQWCDFVSFDPRLPEKLQLKIHRVKRDQNIIDEIQWCIDDFLGELREKVRRLEQLEAA